MNDSRGPDNRFDPVAKSTTFGRILNVFSLRNKVVLDLGCGYGEYLVHFGHGSIGITTADIEVEHGQLRDLRIHKGNAEAINPAIGRFDAIWSNNLFEHLLAPHAFLVGLKTVANEHTLLILGVPVLPRFVWLTRLRKFRGSLAVAHINFFTREALRLTVERGGWRVRQLRPFMFSNALLDFLFSFIAPHLYVVAENDMYFRYDQKKVQEWKDDPFYDHLLAIGTVRGDDRLYPADAITPGV